MKKIWLLLAVFLLVGCGGDLNNTPTKRVELFLNRYQALDKEVIARIKADIEAMDNLNESEKTKYEELWKKHYQALTYEIKDETIDGDEATVKVEVEVFDYRNVLIETSAALTNTPDMFSDEFGNYSVSIFHDYRLEKLSQTTDKVKYTFDFKVVKVDKKWVLQDLSDSENQKLAGMYIY